MKKLLCILILPLIFFLVSCGGGGSDDLQPIEPPIDTLNINDPTDSLHTWIPDDNFEQQLINHGYDDYKDNQVLTSNILSVTTIDLRDIIQMGIPEVKDLTGIEDFISLESLYTTGNPIEKIDLSSNTELEVLIMGYCYQDTLDLSSNTKLKHLYAKIHLGFINYAKLPISIENLTFYNYKFDRSISEFTNLRDIQLYNCDFDFIIKDLQYLKTLDITFNDITIVDEIIIKNLPDLEYIYLGSVEINEFPPQDFKNLPSLESLILYNTDLNIFSSIEEFPSLENISLVGGAEPGNISNIDLSSATNIQSVGIIGFDSLNNLSLKNGNNSIISSIRTEYNPNLYCISVDDTAHFYSLNSNQLILDPQQYFKINCP